MFHAVSPRLSSGRWRRACAAVAIGIGALSLLSACDDPTVTAPSTNEPDGEAGAIDAFEGDAPLARVREIALDLETEAEGESLEAACAEGADRLDDVGTPQDLAEVAAEVEDERLVELALEQQAGLSSLMAACRGDAPVGVDEAAAELAETNAALEALLDELEGG